MLCDRVEYLFAQLSCNNSDIARYVGCSPSNISRIKSGSRVPKKNSKAIAALASGVYEYARAENLLSELAKLFQSEDTGKQGVVAALVNWLYSEEKPLKMPNPNIKVKSRSVRVHSDFGEKLDALMRVLGMSNVELARNVKVDDSLISRFRSGKRTPGDRSMAVNISTKLLGRAKKLNLESEVELLSGIYIGDLLGSDGALMLSKWLYNSPQDVASSSIEKLLELVAVFTLPAKAITGQSAANILVEKKATYWNDDGLQDAVLRFLSNAVIFGGELCLYSDEKMDWLTGDKEFLAKWSYLMMSCIGAGVRIKIIHNIARSAQEMIDAISSWLPLYLSNMIDAYVLRNPKDARFSKTIFLHTGVSCVLGSHTVESRDRWYEYIEDGDKLDAIAGDFGELLKNSHNLIRVYSGELAQNIRRMATENPVGELRELIFKNVLLLLDDKSVTVFRSGDIPIAFTLTEPLMQSAFSNYFNEKMQQTMLSK